MNHPYHQRFSDVPVVMNRGFLVGVTVDMTFISMLVQMNVDSTGYQPPNKRDTQYNEHYPDSKFHEQSQPIGNSQFKNQHPKANHKDGKSVTDAPTHPYYRRMKKIPAAADNGGYRHNVVSIQGMLNSQQNAKKQGG
jgi:hypothetical protein